MSDTTLIQWASSTWNPWLGCDKVSPGCKLCYIDSTPCFRFRGLKHGDPRQRTSESYWRQPYRWNAKAGERSGLGGSLALPRPRVFPSLCDWLDEKVPIEWLADFLKVIHDTPHLDWLLLTKRPENFKQRIFDAGKYLHKQGKDFMDGGNEALWLEGDPPKNVWIGISAENQEWLDKRWPIAREIPARVHFVSAEPLLGPLDFTSVGPNSKSASERRGGGCTGEFVCNALTGEEPYYRESDGEPCIDWGTQIDWVIVGGESGDGARACNVEWIWDIQMQCKNAGVACFTKQLGALPITENANVFDWPNDPQFYACNGPGVATARVELKHPKGGDSKEWPEELQIMQYPNVAK